MVVRAGDLRERLMLLTTDVAPVVITSLVRTSTTATATTATSHGFTTGDFVLIAGVAQAGWCARFKVTVTSATTFTFTVSASLSSPASGTMTASYHSDSTGGRQPAYRTVATFGGKLNDHKPVPESLKMGAIQSTVEHIFTIRRRADISASQRMRWYPSAGGPVVLLTIVALNPNGDGRQWLDVFTSEVSS